MGLHGVLLCSDAGAIVWVCDCLHWMLSTLMCSNAGALVRHVRVPHGVSSTWLCSDSGAVVWACKCAANIGALMLVWTRQCACMGCLMLELFCGACVMVSVLGY